MKTLTMILMALVVMGASECEEGDGGDVDSDVDSDSDADNDTDTETEDAGTDCPWTCSYGSPCGDIGEGWTHCEEYTCPYWGAPGKCCAPPWEC